MVETLILTPSGDSVWEISPIPEDETSDAILKLFENSGTSGTSYLLAYGYLRKANVWHVYGGFQDEAETIECTEDVWAKVTNAGGDLWSGTEADGFILSNDVMTVINAGDYIGHVSITISGGVNDDFYFRVYNNTQVTQMGSYLGVTTMGANNFQTISLPLYLECNAGDELQMEIMNPTNNDDCVVRDAVFYIAYLHE